MGGRFERLSLGNFQLRLDPQIEAEIRRLGLGQPSSKLRNHVLRPNWAAFQQSHLDQILQQPPPQSARPKIPRGAGPAKPKPADVGDLAKAVWKLPAVQQAADRLLGDVSHRARRHWNQATPGQRALLVTQTTVISGAALAGVLSQRDTRNSVLDFVSGKDIPVPGVEGLSLQLRHESGRGDYGGIVSFDLAPYLR